MIDRGTKFGLQMKEPRTESILMSCAPIFLLLELSDSEYLFLSVPLTARWEYQPEQGTIEGTPEKRLMDVVHNPIEWV